jgi:hypothetical protein
MEAVRKVAEVVQSKLGGAEAKVIAISGPGCQRSLMPAFSCAERVLRQRVSAGSIGTPMKSDDDTAVRIPTCFHTASPTTPRPLSPPPSLQESRDPSVADISPAGATTSAAGEAQLFM